ncbi:HAD-IA family hydrolase [Candidatus Woesearchaeota archaeon]|nr:HAD-IA family hydrolase [Candidatus Woesearchaeota archaeon]
MKCLLVDLEGVIVGGRRKKYQPWLKSLDANPSNVHEIYQKIVWDLHRGTISCSKAVRIINDSLGTKIPTKEFFKQRTEYPFVNRKVIDFIKKVKKNGVKVYLISDISKYSWEFIKKKYPFLTIFNQRILSFNTGFRKEQPEYYTYLQKRLNCKKCDMVLIDDKSDNISTARKEGLHAIHFTKNTDLKAAKINCT